MEKKITKNSFLDLSILIPYLILSAVGLLMVFSATVPIKLTEDYLLIDWQFLKESL
ncbi:hypothetical protein P9166_14015 [Lactococcus lactis]|nr:hypothetical protein P9166_14015 [Lactococcus lactis]